MHRGLYLALVACAVACRPAPSLARPSSPPSAAPEAPAGATAAAPDPAADPNRPQTPTPPFPYQAHEVTYDNPASGLTLAGTLTVPAGDGRHPAVVLITGSGPQDRDSTIFGHKPFWVLADHLSRRGIAVLRVDDRGVGRSDRGENVDVTSKDFATDVVAGMVFLRSRPEVDAKRIALVGHSEGGLIAPLVAAEDSSVAAIVLLAGPGLPGSDILVEQARAILEARGATAQMVEQAVAKQTKVFAAIAGADDIEAGREAVLEIIGVDTPQTRKLVAQQVVPWTRFFVRHDPAPTLAKVHCPILALGGSLDLQVIAGTNLPAIKAAAEDGGNQDVTTTELAGLNHMFQPATSGLVAEYTEIKTTFDPKALTALTAWLQDRLDVPRTGNEAGARY